MCDTLVVPAKDALHGLTLFAKNSDRERNEAQELEWSPRRERSIPMVRATYINVPDVAQTYACLLSRPYWMWGAEMGANENGVVIGNEAMHSRTPAQRRPALTGMDLVRLGLERGATAAEAVSVITSLLEQYGQGGDCGHLGRAYYHNGFVIADAQEAFVLETVGRWWALERVDRPRALSNAFSISAKPAAISDDLKRHASQAHWTDAQGVFDFAGRMIDETRDLVSFGRGRCARAQKLLGRTVARLDVLTMMNVLRDHGDADGDGWSPERTQNRTICMHAGPGLRRSQTVGSLVAEIGASGMVCWVTASAAPCLSIFKPVLHAARPTPVAAPSDTPQDLQNRWWRHERFHRRALEDFPSTLASIREERGALEQSFVLRMGSVAQASDRHRRAMVDQCWREADAAEERWFGELVQRPQGARTTSFQRSWRRLNQVAGLRL